MLEYSAPSRTLAEPALLTSFIYMAKLPNMIGKARGKVGAIVYAISGGQQIAREYQPVVTNPNTSAQIEGRSKLKLMSQVAAAMSDSIAIRKDGLKSSRNLFISTNYKNVVASDGLAQVNLNKIQLTKSNVGIIGFSADRSDGQKIAVRMNEDVSANFDRIVYTAYKKDAAGNLLLVGSAVAENQSNDGHFAADLPYTQDSVVVYAYGIKFQNSAASVAFGNMSAPSAEQVAKLVTNSAEVAAGTGLSRTVGLNMMQGESQGDSDDVEHFTVSLSKQGNGSVSGAGRFAAGSTVTVVATPDAEARFIAWKLNTQTGTTVSNDAVYSFVIEEDITLVAIFAGGPVPTHTISVSANPQAGGSVSGGGTVSEGDTCTLTATPASGFTFAGWLENGNVVSSNANYSFTVTADRTLVASFVEIQPAEFSNVLYNNEAWNSNKMEMGSVTPTIKGDINTADENVKICLAHKQGGAQPQVGDAVIPLADPINISTFATGSTMGTVTSAFTAYLCAVRAASGSQWIVEGVFQYNIGVMEG